MTIPVFYIREQVVLDNVSDSPSAGKPVHVVESWRASYPIEVYRPLPVTREDYYLAHDKDHVDAVLDLKKANGFGNKLASVAKSLPWTTGSLLTAARHAIAEQTVAVSPTSGFHHAGPAKCDGYCTFNGLMVAAIKLRSEGATRIGILDCDEHYGNGTDEIIAAQGIDYIEHYTYGAEDLQRGEAQRWLDQLPAILDRYRGCDVVLYQAGADPHWDDPYGRGVLKTEHLLERDRIVFRSLRTMKVPVAWNLAGGYQTPLRRVLDIHDNTMKACCETYL
jgi:acetoin utilization deacetylase AcuC-like enzyme